MIGYSKLAYSIQIGISHQSILNAIIVSEFRVLRIYTVQISKQYLDILIIYI